MNSLGKLVVRMGLLSLLCVIPLAAQIENGVDFKTTFPFYAGNARMPASVEPTKAETKAATNTSVVEHSVVASNR